MAKKKAQEEQMEVVEGVVESGEKSEAPAQDLIAKAKAEAKAEALKEIQAELGITPQMLEAKKAQKKAESEQYEVDLGHQVVRINGKYYSGKVIVSRPVAEVLVEMASKKRERLLNEHFSRKFQIEQLAEGGFRARLISKERVDS